MTISPLPWQPDASTPMWAIACVNYGGDLHLYSGGFRGGAEVVLQALRQQQHGQDLLVYPLVYGLRHAVELALKQVIRGGRSLIEEPGDFPDNHNLGHLWDTCRPILKRIWPGDNATYSQVAVTVKGLCAIDPEGEGFRYPVSTRRKGARTPTLSSKLEQLDLQRMFDDVGATLELLDGADTGIDVYQEAKADMMEENRQIENEMRAEFEAEMRAEYSNEY